MHQFLHPQAAEDGDLGGGEAGSGGTVRARGRGEVGSRGGARGATVGRARGAAGGGAGSGTGAERDGAWREEDPEWSQE